MEQVSTNCDMNLIDRLYRSCYHDLKMYIMGYTHDEMCAEDMVQELFIKVMKVDSLTSKTARNLLFVMAGRMIVDDARHKAFVRRLHDGVAQVMDKYDSVSVVERITCRQIEEHEERRLLTMAPQRALVYRMWRKEDLTAGEIADRLNLSKRTVENHLYLSRKEMKESLKHVI